MKHKLALAITILLCTLAMSVTAQDTQWSLTKGDNIIEASPADVHVKQRDPKDTNAFALARKPLHLAGTSWRVAFDVRYGELQPVGSTVKLGIGDRLIGAVGGDEKGINVYLGNDTVKFLQRTDAEWHHFEFICDGTTSSVWHNGVKINEEPTQGKPDTLIVGAWSEGKWLSRQTELWMRNLDTNTANPSSQTPPLRQPTTSPPPPQTFSMVLDFTPSFDTASLIRETDTPQHPLDLTLTTDTLEGQTTGALHVRTPNLTDHDVLHSPKYPVSPTTSDDAKTVLWARGDAHTPALMFEWDERDGTRWIATFPITEHWQQLVLSPKDFHPWLVAADRARLGFHPRQAVHFRIGLDASNSHTSPGPHEYWVAQIATQNKNESQISQNRDSTQSETDLSQLRHQLILKDAIIAALRLQLAGNKSRKAGNKSRKGRKSLQSSQEATEAHKQDQAATLLQTAAQTQLTQVNVNVQVSVTQPEVSHDTSAEMVSQVDAYNRTLDRVRLLMRDEDNCLDVAERCLTWVRLNEYASPETRLSVLGVGQRALGRSDQDNYSLKNCLYQALALYRRITADPSFSRFYAEGDYCTATYYLDDDLRAQGA